ncbi:hypothetical protein PTTG_08632 [Puccinia triticina 1-1 BBBD Race 1]|uniref:Xpo1 domain-containing protein n=1 Tax=Puccinia triticina (isolate 1-1 / race 1 (BBBD)) TaxID=630390 RepID=A0A180G973_PUCT1|nr:hypothetical protein PTTG_08632 [Puccinia triticina 1-1 BBBD Race 1]
MGRKPQPVAPGTSRSLIISRNALVFRIDQLTILCDQCKDKAWITSDVILKTQEAPIKCKLFAAQTFCAKITFDLDQLPEPHRLQLRDSLLTALSQDLIISSKIILVQLCLSLANLALQLPEWPTVVTNLIEKFGKDPKTVPVLLEFLTVFPQEIVGNLKIQISYDIIVQAMPSNSNVKWQDIKAPLFLMRTMGAKVDLKEDGVLPMIMDIIPRLPAHPKIQYATILVLCRYTEWTNLHPNGISFQLQYISSGFDQTSRSPSHEIHLITYLPQLHSFYQNMSLTLGQDDMNKVSAAIAHIIAGLPAPQGAAAMSTICMPPVEGLHNIAARKQAPTKQVQQNVLDLLERLDMFLLIIGRLEGDLLPDCLKLMGEIWTVISEILEQYGSSIKLSDRICALIRRGLTFYGEACLPLIGSVLEEVTAGFEASGCSSYLWITSKIVAAFPERTDPNFLSAVQLAFERQSNRVFPLLNENNVSLLIVFF